MKIVCLLAFALGFLACEKEHPPVDTDWKEGVIHFTGEVALDGCGWLLLSEGESYHVSNLEEKYKQDGLDVWFKGSDLAETFSCGLAQTKYDVKEIDEMIEKPWKARYLKDYPDKELSLDMLSMDSVQIDGDSIRFHVGYSGGCGIHQFNLWILETGMEGNGDTHLQLEHIGNGDPCEAYPWEWLSFSLESLQELNNRKVTFWLRGNPMMSMLFGPYTYKY